MEVTNSNKKPRVAVYLGESASNDRVSGIGRWVLQRRRVRYLLGLWDRCSKSWSCQLASWSW